MGSKIKIVAHEAPAQLRYEDLEEGDWYSSGTRYGICIKLTPTEALSVTLSKVFEVASENWPCTRLNVLIKYRPA